ncbi:putative quinol monooxygenase [Streptomyces sp. NPDC056707]|uniref:putative quinol monooxygenase n=1 Tax=Streptomyces sp. NPDC056707 TaxID=3345919 RepID=UPI0036A86320
MTAFGFLVTMEAKPGKEEEVADFLRSAEAMVEAEPGTVAWFAVRLGPASFRIFDAFDSENDRQSHFDGEVRHGLAARVDLFIEPPRITPVNVLAAKLPT